MSRLLKERIIKDSIKYWPEYVRFMLFIFHEQFSRAPQDCLSNAKANNTVNPLFYPLEKNISTVKVPIEEREGPPSKSDQWSDNSNIHLRRKITQFSFPVCRRKRTFAAMFPFTSERPKHSSELFTLCLN